MGLTNVKDINTAIVVVVISLFLVDHFTAPLTSLRAKIVERVVIHRNRHSLMILYVIETYKSVFHRSNRFLKADNDALNDGLFHKIHLDNAPGVSGLFQCSPIPECLFK